MKNVTIASTIMIVALAAPGAVLLGGHPEEAVQASTVGQETPVQPPANLTLGKPSVAASMTKDQVLSVVAEQFGEGVLGNPVSVNYGSFTDNSYKRVVGGSQQAVGTIDAWEVTVSGLNMPRPCPMLNTAGTTGCPPVHTLAVIVDDNSQSYVEAVGW